jgi:hypothetical protein
MTGDFNRGGVQMPHESLNFLYLTNDEYENYVKIVE